MKTRPAIVAIGEAMVEFNHVQPEPPLYKQGFGGDTSNAVIAAARQGATCAYITRIGKDEFGELLLNLWQQEQIITSGVHVDEGASTGIYFVTHNDDGHAFTYRREGSAASRIQPSDLDGDLIRGAKFLLVSAISQAISQTATQTVAAAIDHAHAADVKVCYDPNLRLSLWSLERARTLIRETVSQADYFLPSLDDARAFTGLQDPDAIIDWGLKAGAKTVLLKMGKDGAIVATASMRQRVPGCSVAAVDATGAGDCFAGSLLARLSAGDELVDAVRYANAAAGLSTMGHGAIAPIPRAEAVTAFLQKMPALTS